MFQLPDSMRQGFAVRPRPKATLQDIQSIEHALGVSLPKPYIEFVTDFGFVLFGRDVERRRSFECRYASAGQTEVRKGDVAFMHQPERLIRAYRTLTSADDPADQSLPAFPASYLPVANDAGQGQILLELGPQHGRVWYWAEKEWRWGTEDNTELGFVADDFYDFINHLQPDPP